MTTLATRYTLLRDFASVPSSARAPASRMPSVAVEGASEMIQRADVGEPPDFSVREKLNLTSACLRRMSTGTFLLSKALSEPANKPEMERPQRLVRRTD